MLFISFVIYHYCFASLYVVSQRLRQIISMALSFVNMCIYLYMFQNIVKKYGSSSLISINIHTL